MSAPPSVIGPTVLSLSPDATSVYRIREDGLVWTNFFPAADGQSSWNGWFPLGANTFPTASVVSAVSTGPGETSLYVLGSDGQVWTNFFPAGSDGKEWFGWSALGPNVFPKEATVTALSLARGATSLYVMGIDGQVWTNFFPAGEDGKSWFGWSPLGGHVFPTNAAVSAVSTGPGETSLYVLGSDGQVWTNFFPAGSDGKEWFGWSALGPNVFPKEATVTALSLARGATSLYVMGIDGQVWTNFFPAGEDGKSWFGWSPLGGHVFPTNAAVSAVSTGPGETSLYVLGSDGQVWTNFFPAGSDGKEWFGWSALGPNVFPNEATVSVVSTTVGATSLYVMGLDDQLWTKFFPVGSEQGVWSDWMPMAPWSSLAPIVLTTQLITGGLAALGGWITITIHADGSVRWQGEGHDSGADGYGYSVSALVTSPSGASVAMAHSGSVGGLIGGSRSDPWDVTYQDAVTGLFSAFTGATLHSNLQYTSDFGSFATGVIDWALKFFVAGTVPALGSFVIFLGAEVVSVISSGSLVPGAVVIEGALFMAGPFNTLISLGAAAIVRLGSNSRQLTHEEYDWANGPTIYAGALPPIDKLLLTDTINGDRAFTFPRWDGKIAINIGPEAYNDPRTFGVDKGRKPGNVFLHELLHACQMDSAPASLDLFACAVSARLCEAIGKDPYPYPNAGPDYVHFGLEQQAQIVGDWATGYVPSYGNQTSTPSDTSSPYYPYIVNNVRTRNLWAVL